MHDNKKFLQLNSNINFHFLSNTILKLRMLVMHMKACLRQLADSVKRLSSNRFFYLRQMTDRKSGGNKTLTCPKCGSTAKVSESFKQVMYCSSCMIEMK